MAVQLTFIDSVPLQNMVVIKEDGTAELSLELITWMTNLVDTINTDLQLIQDAIP
ncbi:MAG: hypothetical protein KBC53_02725 [Nitrosomonas sp.]|nr:hypothetical protein [Nitrosomonas sp.]